MKYLYYFALPFLVFENAHQSCFVYNREHRASNTKKRASEQHTAAYALLGVENMSSDMRKTAGPLPMTVEIVSAFDPTSTPDCASQPTSKLTSKAPNSAAAFTPKVTSNSSSSFDFGYAAIDPEFRPVASLHSSESSTISSLDSCPAED